MTVSPEKIAQWKALFALPMLADAPWDFVESPLIYVEDGKETITDSCTILAGPEQTEYGEMGSVLSRYREELRGHYSGDLTSLDDWRFIAAARTGWPEAVDALEEAYKLLQEQLEEFCAIVCPYCHTARTVGGYAPARIDIFSHTLFPNWEHPANGVMPGFHCEATPLRRKAYLRRYEVKT